MSLSPPLAAVAGVLPLSGTTPVPAAGETVKAADVQMAAQGLLDQDATLELAKANRAGDTFTGDVHIAQTKAIVADGTGATLSGTWTISGANTHSGNNTFTAFNTFTNTCSFEGADSVLSILGRLIPRSARVAVADSAGTKTLAVATGGGVDYAGKRFSLAAPAAPRTRILKSTTVVPSEGETIEVLYRDSSPGGGTQFTITREDASVICLFVVETVGHPQGVNLWAEFEFVGGAWRLGASTGSQYSTTDSTNVGVVPGASA
jgi:hypothetical protein